MSGAYQDVVVSDFFDLPGLGPERKDLANPCLPDKLFVQFPYSSIAIFVTQLEIAPVRYDATREIERQEGAATGLDAIVYLVYPDPGF